MFVNRLSRLVVDPERFPDEREEMAAVGMGAVYTRTSGGEVLRSIGDEDTSELVRRYFDPYSVALADLIDERVEATGRAVLIDLHSYPQRALPYELHHEARRRAVCIGTDPLHTPAELAEAAQLAFAEVGAVAINEPFIGTYVPLRHYGTRLEVSSVMVEIRRDVYLRDGELRRDGFDSVVAGVLSLLRWTARAA